MSHTDHLQNWAKNLTYAASKVHRPKTVEEIRYLVQRAGKIRAIGTGHSFNRLADTTHELISLANFCEVEMIDTTNRSVTIQPGVTYGRLSPLLQRHGFALPNLASLPHISVTGACATATHGSGVGNQNLATSVSSFEAVMADGSLKSFSRNQDAEIFEGVVVALGGLGIVTRLSLDIVPTFEMQQDVYERLPYDQLEKYFDEIVSSGYSVSLFLDWKSPEINQIWVKRKIENGTPVAAPGVFFGAPAATRKLHPLPDISAEYCTEQQGIPGPWYDRLPHFRMEFTPSSGEELQSEFFVERRNAFEALTRVRELGEQISPLLLITEIRTVAADSLWMSPSYNRKSVAIHFTWKQMTAEVEAILPKIEEILEPFQARPHWGKIFTMSGKKLYSLYPRMEEFRQLLRRLDPEGKFENAFLSEKIFDVGAG